MQIQRLEIENIKRYKEATFDFPMGINFICGKNGAGKTTIIESIGFALFDHKIIKQGFAPYFVRKGENKGRVRVYFTNQEGKAYIADRKISLSGANNSWSIKQRDGEAELAIVEKDEEVRAWLKANLGFGEDDNISDLYSKIISVPQGEFTVAFLGSESTRRETFDPIFQLESYKKAAANIKLESGLKLEIEEKQREIHYKKGEIDHLSGSEVEYKVKEGELGEKQVEIAQIQQVLIDREERYRIFEGVRRQMEQNQQELDRLVYTLESRTQQIQIKEKELEEANKALGILKENQVAYREYERALADKQRAEEELKSLNKIKEEIKVLANRIENGKGKTQERRRSLEGQRQEIEGLEREIKEAQPLLEALKKDLKKEGEQLEEQRAFILETEKKLEAYTKGLQQIENLKNQEKTFNEKILLLKKQIKGMAGAEEGLQEYAKKQEEKKALEEKIQSLKEEQARLYGRKASLIETERQIQGGVCPFLQEKCINLENNNPFEKEKEEMNLQLAAIEKEMADLQGALQAYLQVDGLMAKALAQIDQLKNVRKALGEEAWALGQLIKEREDLEVKLRKRISSHVEFDEEVQTFLEQYKKSLEEKKLQYQKDLLEKSKREERIKQEEEQLAKLEKSFREKKEIYIKEEKELQNWEKGLRDLRDKLNEEKEKVQQYNDPEKKIEDLNGALDKTKQGYALYVANEKEGSKVEGLTVELEELRKNLQSIHEKIDVCKNKGEELNRNYNEGEYEAVKGEIETLKVSKSSLEVLIEMLKKALGDLAIKVNKLHQTKAEVEILEREIIKLQRVQKMVRSARDIIKEAPDAIAKVLIQNISNKAGEIYTKIAADNAKLEWKEQYNLVLQDTSYDTPIEKEFRQLSGGERMSAALAIRLAMLQLVTNLQIGMLDEPTENMDVGRRERLAEVIEEMSGGLNQLFLISHDDTFHSITENIIALEGEISTT